MPWFKIDDSFWGHPKVLGIPRKERTAAVGLWALAGSWCAQQLTDGKLGDHMLDEFGSTEKSADWLVKVRLWEKTEDGYVFHDWETWQPSRAQVEERREAEAKRKQEWRDKKRARRSGHAGVPAGQERDTPVASGGTDAGVPDVSALPDPTRPDPTTTSTPSSADADGAFDEFWDLYPRKVGKQDARRVWDRKTRKTDPTEIIDGLRRYLPTYRQSEKQFIPHPSTWLQQGRWEDEVEGVDANGDINPDDILGRDLWQLPAPPEDIVIGSEQYRTWARATRDQHKADRIVEARAALAKKRGA